MSGPANFGTISFIRFCSLALKLRDCLQRYCPDCVSVRQAMPNPLPRVGENKLGEAVVGYVDRGAKLVKRAWVL